MAKTFVALLLSCIVHRFMLSMVLHQRTQKMGRPGNEVTKMVCGSSLDHLVIVCRCDNWQGVRMYPDYARRQLTLQIDI